MSIMEDVILNAKTAVDNVTRKAGKVVDRSRLRLAALDIKTELSKKYRLLGRVCYESHKTGKSFDKTVQTLTEQITELIEELEAVNEQWVRNKTGRQRNAGRNIHTGQTA